MANTTIQILRSYANTAPPVLDDGELAYSFVSNTLFIGSKTGDIILDPFMGSGTTAISCIDLKRQYLGVELHQEYIDMTLNRIRDYDIKNSQIKLDII